MSDGPNPRRWWQSGTLYQVYLMSFADGNGDGIGDLPGLIGKIPYLADLGIDAVWVSPFTSSPLEYDCGYGPASLTEINPLFGTIEDFDRLVREAERYGIRIVLEWAATNASVFGEWFLESKSDRVGPKSDWFLWSDTIPNNWRCFVGGSAWHYSPERNQYYLGTFFREHADLNWRNDAVQEAVLSAMGYWLDRGAKGFRIDTVNMYVKDRELRDEPDGDPPAFLTRALDPVLLSLSSTERYRTVLPEYHYQTHTRTTDQPEVLDVIRRYRALCDTYGDDIYLLGEVDVGEQFGREACAAGLDQAFNFTMSHGALSGAELRKVIDRESVVLSSGRGLNAFSNHDIGRAISRVPSESPIDRQSYARLLALLAFTLPGTPMVYYGEEIGLLDVSIRPDEFFDPLARRYPYLTDLPVFNRERARGAMRWDDSLPCAGFSTGRPWIRSAETAEGGGAEMQRVTNGSLFRWYKNLIRFRAENPAATSTQLSMVSVNNDDVVAYSRGADGERHVVVLNFSSSPYDWSSIAPGRGVSRVIFSTRGEGVDGVAGDYAETVLGPSSGIVLGTAE